MKIFRENIIGAFGTKGEKWLSNLDNIITSLQEHWQLDSIRPVENMTYHYVAKAHTHTSKPVVLKIGCSQELIETEAYILNHFDGQGTVRVIDHNPKYHALLLQQAIPGVSLKSLYPQQLEYVMAAYINCVKHLHSASTPTRNFKHIVDWLKALDRIETALFPDGMLDKAISLRDEMLSTMGAVKLLHGDLHLDNILKNKEEWLAIDPQGVLGEAEFEVAAFDFIAEDEMNRVTREQILERISQIANRANLSFERLRNWTFIRLVLSAAWSIEDKGNPKKAMFLAKLLM